MRYNKLVRDRYPELIAEKHPKMRIAGDEEYKQKLREKILEEAEELLHSASKEELADTLEAIECYIEAEQWNKGEIEQLKKDKAERKGSFKRRIILIETD